MRFKTLLLSSVAGLAFIASIYFSPSVPLAREPIAHVATSVDPPAPMVVSEVEATTPVLFRVPSLNIEASIEEVGLTPEGNMAAPQTNTQLGWYKYGAPPGNAGPAVLAAHTGLPSQPTAFRQFETLKRGDMVEVKDAKGLIIPFKIIDRAIYDPETAPRHSIFGHTTVARLALITCIGTWLPEKNTYSHRLVIYAVRTHN